ncbi:MAG: hypothetical protein AAGI22_16900 [Planctomycetota bacterium]
MRSRLFLSLVAITSLTACPPSNLRNDQLESVAKDWSLVVRASQVIPVYPLSEDLQPGDVLLVSTPIENQVSIYESKGFLPLDQHLARIYSDEFDEFYDDRYGISADVVPPSHWQQPAGDGPDAPHGWDAAPRASFPSYQFSVRTGAGLNLAIPIQGVPFALGLMNSGQASGTVTISDAYTYGLDNVRLEAAVRRWASEHRPLLRNYAPVDGKYHYLRVVSRVYVTGAVSVTIHNDEATSGEVGAGADRPVELLGVKEGATEENFSSAIATINELAAEQLPGAKIKIATASSRAVTMNETFDRPLALGYVGFDMPVLAGGRLGAPLSTLEQLNRRPTIARSSAGGTYRLAALRHVAAALREMRDEGDERAEDVLARLDGLAEALPQAYPFTGREFDGSGTAIPIDGIARDGEVPRATWGDVLDFQGYARATVETLERFVNDGGTLTDELQADLEGARSALQRLDEDTSKKPVVMEAIDLAFFGS